MKCVAWSASSAGSDVTQDEGPQADGSDRQKTRRHGTILGSRLLRRRYAMEGAQTMHATSCCGHVQGGLACHTSSSLVAGSVVKNESKQLQCLKTYEVHLQC